MDNSPKTESIKNLIENIDKEIIVLPEFQRDFVWEIGKTYDLFDSLIKDIFIGSIIYGVPSFEITARELDKRPRKGEGSRKKLKLIHFKKDEVEREAKTSGFRLVLDGQQRITSIYRALKGMDEVWFVSRNLDELPHQDFSKFKLEDLLYEFTGQEEVERLSIKMSDVYETMTNYFLEEEIKEKFFNKLKFLETKDYEERTNQFRTYLTIRRNLEQFLNADKLLSFYLLDTSAEKFSLFFERSNSKGIQLNFIDILAAKLYVGFNLRSEVESFESSNNGYELNREIIVRAISFLVSDGKNVQKSYILANLNAQHFNQYWKKLCEFYKQSIDFLYKNHFILSQSWMPYQNMLIPLMLFLSEIKDFSQMNEKQFDFIRFWYWASIFSERYSGSSNEVILQDSKILQQVAKDSRVTDKSYFQKLKLQVEKFEEVLSYNKKGSAIYSGFLNLVNYEAEGLIDWKNTSKLSFNGRLEDHHIFPKEFLKTSYKENEDALELVDSVANRTLIPKITNIKIGKKSPSQYLPELEESNPEIRRSLAQHLVPEETIEGLYDELYTIFLEDRARKMFELVKKYVIDEREQIISDFYTEQQIVDSPDKQLARITP